MASFFFSVVVVRNDIRPTISLKCNTVVYISVYYYYWPAALRIHIDTPTQFYVDSKTTY